MNKTDIAYLSCIRYFPSCKTNALWLINLITLFYLFLMKTATKKTNSVIINKEIKPLFRKIVLLDQCLASL